MCHRQNSYLPAVGMLQRLQHTAAIVLPLGQAHGSIILLLSLLWTGQSGTRAPQLAWLTGAPCVSLPHSLLCPYIFPCVVGTFLSLIKFTLAGSLYFFPLSLCNPLFYFSADALILFPAQFITPLYISRDRHCHGGYSFIMLYNSFTFIIPTNPCSDESYFWPC